MNTFRKRLKQTGMETEFINWMKRPTELRVGDNVELHFPETDVSKKTYWRQWNRKAGDKGIITGELRSDIVNKRRTDCFRIRFDRGSRDLFVPKDILRRI